GIHFRESGRIAVDVLGRPGHAHQQRRKQGARRAAHRRQQLVGRELEGATQVFRLDLGAHSAQRLEPANQVEYVVPIADLLVEDRDFAGVLLHRCVRRLDAVHHHLAIHERILRPSAEKKRRLCGGNTTPTFSPGTNMLSDVVTATTAVLPPFRISRCRSGEYSWTSSCSELGSDASPTTTSSGRIVTAAVAGGIEDPPKRTGGRTVIGGEPRR